MKTSVWVGLGIAVAGMLADAPAIARGGGHGGGHRTGAQHASTSGHVASGGGHRSSYAPGVARDKHGRIARDPHATAAFKRNHPCPSTGKSYGSCPGYVIDHVQPLKRGGADAPSNMQWQTREEARRKDRTE